jgi:hypothetical protein
MSGLRIECRGGNCGGQRLEFERKFHLLPAESSEFGRGATERRTYFDGRLALLVERYFLVVKVDTTKFA